MKQQKSDDTYHRFLLFYLDDYIDSIATVHIPLFLSKSE